MIDFLFIFVVLVSEFDPTQTVDVSSTPLTHDLIALCVGTICIVLVILLLAVCKWSRCLCLKRNHDNYGQTEGFSSVIQPNTSTPHSFSQRHRSQNQQFSPCDRPGHSSQQISTTRNGFLSPPQLFNNEHHSNDVKLPRVTITKLSVQSSQQLVPRLSINPQASGSSITHSTYNNF
jgi:hypothetical protein